jgi:hypothetical protein
MFSTSLSSKWFHSFMFSFTYLHKFLLSQIIATCPSSLIVLDLIILIVIILYYFEYNSPSNLRTIQFLNVDFMKKLKKCIFLEFKSHLDFSTEKKICKICFLYSK